MQGISFPILLHFYQKCSVKNGFDKTEPESLNPVILPNANHLACLDIQSYHFLSFQSSLLSIFLSIFPIRRQKISRKQKNFFRDKISKILKSSQSPPLYKKISFAILTGIYWAIQIYQKI